MTSGQEKDWVCSLNPGTHMGLGSQESAWGSKEIKST